MRINIVLADDHQILREGLKALLEIEDRFKVIAVGENGKEAVDLVRQHKPDILIIDIAMPILNGIEATRKVREICPETKVIILSMLESSEHIYQALKAGAKGYLLKEAAGKEVKQAIDSVMQGNNYLSDRIEKHVIDDFLLGSVIKSEVSPIESLSGREREILQLVVEGKTSLEIGEAIFLSPKTVETYRSRLMNKLGMKDIPALVKFAIKNGLTSLDS